MSRRNTTFWSKVGETGVGEMGVGEMGVGEQGPIPSLLPQNLAPCRQHNNKSTSCSARWFSWGVASLPEG